MDSPEKSRELRGFFLGKTFVAATQVAIAEAKYFRHGSKRIDTDQKALIALDPL
ncbi:MAG: hypothetical protein ABIP44_04670 [Pseudoxanthomonas sp.]